MSNNILTVDHGAHIAMGKLLNLLNFMGGSETIEKVEKGYSGFQRCGLSYECKIHDFLNRT